MNLITRVHTKLSSLFPERKRNRHVSFLLVLLGASLDNINVCGSLSVYKSIVEKFDADTPTASWTLSAYALTLGSFIMLAGKMTDILGPKVVFLSGLFFSSLFALICAVVENEIIILIVFRALQGIAASVMVPSMFPIAYSYYSEHGMSGALICIMVMMTGSNGLGLVIGGAFSLTDIGYKGLYYFTFALGFTVSTLLYLTMCPVPIHSDNESARLKNLDWPGTAILVVGILLVILGLTEGGESWKRPSAYVPVPVGILVVFAGLLFELVYIQNYKIKIDKQRSEALRDKAYLTETAVVSDWRYDLQMILPRDAFKITNFFPWFISVVFLFLSFISMLSLCVQYSEYIEGDNSLIAGLKTLPITIGLSFGAMTNKERIIYRINMKWVVISSQVAQVGTIVWFSFHDYHRKGNYWIFEFTPLFLFGYFINTFFGVYINAIMRNTPGHLQGVVAGLFQTGGQVGICLGNALIATLLGVMELPQNETEKEEVAERFKHCYYLAIGIQVAVVVSLLPLKNQPSVFGKPKKSDDSAHQDAEALSTVAIVV